jgi:PadR family transcriptional regulator AphA
MDVRTLCLGALTERPMSGYEIKKRFEEAFRHFFPAGFGSIYPALAALAEAGLVAAESVEGRAGRPDKKVYRITGAGREALAAGLLAAGPRHKVRSEFLALLYFAHLLPPERVAAVLDAMVAEWERVLLDDLNGVERRRAAAGDGGEPLPPGARFALGYGRTVLAASLAYVKRQRPGLLRELGAGAGAVREAAE